MARKSNRLAIYQIRIAARESGDEVATTMVCEKQSKTLKVKRAERGAGGCFTSRCGGSESRWNKPVCFSVID